MKHALTMIAVVGCMGMVSTVSATLIFSDVSYTASTVSFRVTGDLSGYALPSRPDFFSLGFEGDLYTSGVYPNVFWSDSIFAGATIQYGGSSGDWDNWNNPGAWLLYEDPLNSSSVALGGITTLTLGSNVLNESSLTGEISFNWDAELTSTSSVELGRVSIPEPASLGLLGLVTGGIYFARRFFIA